MDYNIRNGRTYMYFDGEPLYPFGYGLSFTSFEYSNLKASSEELKLDGTLTVTVDVVNVGKRDGEEVVQLYVEHVNSAVERPKKELKAFRRIPVKAGKKVSVELSLPVMNLAYWNIEKHSWVVEEDEVIIKVGGSSSDEDLKQSCRIELRA
jgi:beta-glucosidase